MRPTLNHLAALTLLASGLMALPLHAEKPARPVSTALQPFVDHQVLAGAVSLVATKDKVLNVDTVGYADIAAKKPMHEDALFWIASMSKPMTGAAFMILVDEGKVKMDDPVEKYLPEFKGQMVIAEKDDNHRLLKKPQHPILLRNILSHTSGLPFKSPIEQPTLDMIPLATAVTSHAMSSLEFEPDTKYQYSNAGINTAGRIIEVVSGMKYEEFMQKRLFEPLGMKDTTFFPTAEQVARLAKAYKPNADKSGLEETQVTQLHYPLTDSTRQPMPGGGLFSTAADVLKFCQMVANGGVYQGKRLISEASVKAMTSKQTAEGLAGYGFGFAIGPNNYGHGGAYSTNMTIDSQKGLITIFMVQHAGWRSDEGKQIMPAFHKAAAALAAP